MRKVLAKVPFAGFVEFEIEVPEGVDLEDVAPDFSFINDKRISEKVIEFRQALLDKASEVVTFDISKEVLQFEYEPSLRLLQGHISFINCNRLKLEEIDSDEEENKD